MSFTISWHKISSKLTSINTIKGLVDGMDDDQVEGNDDMIDACFLKVPIPRWPTSILRVSSVRYRRPSLRLLRKSLAEAAYEVKALGAISILLG